MAKAILIIDMPDYCAECEMCQADKSADYYCVLTGEDLNAFNKAYKSKRCRLKALPKRRREGYRNDIEVYNAGFNACLDEIPEGEI